MLTVRNFSVRVRAAQHGQSMETEVGEFLESAISPKGRVKLGSLLADVVGQAEWSDEEFTVFDQVRDKAPFCPVSFE